MDSVIIYIQFRNIQPPISLKVTAASLIKNTLANYINQSTETELDFFIKYLLKAI